MATQAEHKIIVEDLQNSLKTVLTITVEQLTREVELGNQLSFKKGEELFVRILELFKKVSSVDLSTIPYSMLTNFQGQLNHAISIFDQIKSFAVNTNNPIGVRDSLIAQLEAQFDSYYTMALPILSTGLLNTNDLSLERAKLTKVLVEVETEREKARKEAEVYLKEIESTLDKARQAAVEVGVAQHNMIFRLESDEHKKLANTWLKWTIFVLIAITLIGFALLFVIPDNTGASYLVQFTVTKIVILTSLFYALSICSRNYKAHKHNSILNKHRQNALNTFETFSKAAGGDTQTKNAVLLEATHTIFSNQQTGYLNTDNDGDSPNKIIEIIKSTNAKND